MSHPAPNTFLYANVMPPGVPGSNLKSLARIHYGDENQWQQIFNANRRGIRRADGTPGLIENPNMLRVGWRLVIPR